MTTVMTMIDGEDDEVGDEEEGKNDGGRLVGAWLG